MNTLIFASRFLAAAWVSSCATLALAGPINPPAGPVAPTPGPEPRIAINDTNTAGDADSLFKITAPGSYYLTGNITGVVGKRGIEIASGGVSIDLNGFDLVGVPGSQDGVAAPGAFTNITVTNGSVRNWGGQGVDLFNAQNTRLTNLNIFQNLGFGLAAGSNAFVSDCSVLENGAGGIRLVTNGIIARCAVRGNVGDGCSTGLACVISECTIRLNTGNGISTNSSVVRGCTLYANSGHGINAVSASTVTDCTVSSSGLDGILVGSASTVRQNQCYANGTAGSGAGIHVTGDDNRIEANNCTAADRGLNVGGSGNFIVRNSCSGNTVWNWDIAGGNVALIVNAGTNPGAFAGNAGGVAPGSTDPNANFTY